MQHPDTPLSDIDLARIETRGSGAEEQDVLRLVAEIRRLKALLEVEGATQKSPERQASAKDLRWRMQLLDGAQRIELQGSEVLDEVSFDGWLHLEQLTDDVWWLRVGDVQLHVSVTPESPPRVDVLRGAYAEAVGTTEAWDPVRLKPVRLSSAG